MADEKRATEKTKKMEELYETTTKEERMKLDKERKLPYVQVYRTGQEI